MSKTSVGDVYAKVINDVCEHSRQDFEEGGVELATLDLLRSEWQKKLSGLKVAQFPWDLTPAPPVKETTLPSNAKPIPPTLPSNGDPVSTPPSQQSTPSAAPVKTENATSSYPTQPPPAQSYQAPSFQQGQPMTARDRAAMNLHQSFGQRAGPQIAQLQSNQQSRVPSQPSGTQSTGYIKQEDPQATFAGVQDYTNDIKDIKPSPSTAINTSQTDGAGDDRDEWETEYAERKAFSAAHGPEADHLIRSHVMARQQELEAGGLLQNLDERASITLANVRKLSGRQSSTTTDPTASLRRAQGDATGDDDDDIDDEDAINSDLDDPDDLAANDGEGENTDQVMLCTYDKVQRVKNKWKCTLKDGVLRVEGNEYVFHKGQGEFEW